MCYQCQLLQREVHHRASRGCQFLFTHFQGGDAKYKNQRQFNAVQKVARSNEQIANMVLNQLNEKELAECARCRKELQHYWPKRLSLDDFRDAMRQFWCTRPFTTQAALSLRHLLFGPLRRWQPEGDDETRCQLYREVLLALQLELVNLPDSPDPTCSTALPNGIFFRRRRGIDEPCDAMKSDGTLLLNCIPGARMAPMDMMEYLSGKSCARARKLLGQKIAEIQAEALLEVWRSKCHPLFDANVVTRLIQPLLGSPAFFGLHECR